GCIVRHARVGCGSLVASVGGSCSTSPACSAGANGGPPVDFVLAQNVHYIHAGTKEAWASPRDSRPRRAGRVLESEGTGGHRPSCEAGRRERVRMGAGRRAHGTWDRTRKMT